MKLQKREIKKHLFICCNKREEGESCGPKEAQALVSALKMKLRENNLWDEIKVTSSGCLGPCKQGISATLYPDNILLTEISEKNFDELYDLLLK